MLQKLGDHILPVSNGRSSARQPHQQQLIHWSDHSYRTLSFSGGMSLRAMSLSLVLSSF